MPDQLQRLVGMRPDAREHAVHLLARFPSLNVSSAYRSAERNRAVGGVEGSLHVQGRAVDVTASLAVLEAAKAYCERGAHAGTPGGPAECFIEHGTGPQTVGGQSTGTHLHVAW